MNKKILKNIYLLALLIPTTLCGCSSYNEVTAPNKYYAYPKRSEKSLVGDPYFEYGLHINAPESTNNKRGWIFDFNHTASKKASPLWTFAQWWDPFNFGINAKYSKSGNKHTYKDESRSLIVDKSTGAFTIECDTYKEYAYRFGDKCPDGTSWCNSLLMQSFSGQDIKYISDLNHLYVSMSFTLNEAIYLGKNFSPVGSECIQALFYCRILNHPRDGTKTPTTAGLWVGVPLYDSRYNHLSETYIYDGGFEGATGSIIYNPDNSSYMGNGPVKIANKYTFKVDALPWAKKAYNYAKDNNYLKDILYNNLRFEYFNIGLEIPGQFKASMTIENLDITYD